MRNKSEQSNGSSLNLLVVQNFILIVYTDPILKVYMTDTTEDSE